VKMLGMPELASDPRFTDPRQRPLHHDDFDAIFWPWCLDRTMAEIVAAAQAAGVPCAPVYAPHHVPEDPQLRARGAFQELRTPRGRFLNISAPFRSTSLGWRNGPSPTLGGANAKVYVRDLGLTSLDAARLLAQRREFKVPSSKFKGARSSLN